MTYAEPIIRDVCGTYAGYQRHTHAKPFEKACGPCRDANAEYSRSRRGASLRYNFPIQAPVDLIVVNGLGAAVARAFRESA